MQPITKSPEHLDVLIVGAGLSGVGAACHLTRKLPGKSFAILEARDAIGGTWDLFRYPGIRSDSDLYTYEYDFKPWYGQPIATAAEILRYQRQIAPVETVQAARIHLQLGEGGIGDLGVHALVLRH